MVCNIFCLAICCCTLDRDVIAERFLAMSSPFCARVWISSLRFMSFCRSVGVSALNGFCILSRFLAAFSRALSFVSIWATSAIFDALISIDWTILSVVARCISCAVSSFTFVVTPESIFFGILSAVLAVPVGLGVVGPPLGGCVGPVLMVSYIDRRIFFIE